VAGRLSAMDIASRPARSQNDGLSSTPEAEAVSFVRILLAQIVWRRPSFKSKALGPLATSVRHRSDILGALDVRNVSALRLM
jgi:hypothetical protein